MGVPRTSSFSAGDAPEENDADDRWRDVFLALLQRASIDDEFRARVEASGAVIQNFEAVLASTRVAHALPCGEIACHEYWWGFQLEIPHAILEAWADVRPDSDRIAATIGISLGPSAPFRRRVAIWLAGHLGELQLIDNGTGVYACMTWMAPNIFLAIPIPAP